MFSQNFKFFPKFILKLYRVFGDNLVEIYAENSTHMQL